MTAHREPVPHRKLRTGREGAAPTTDLVVDGPIPAELRRPLPAHRPEPVRDAGRPVPLVRRRRHGARRRARRRRGALVPQPLGAHRRDRARDRRAAGPTGPTPPMYDSSNTHVIGHAGRILALTEGAMPYELSPTSSTRSRRIDFGGPLPTGLTAHPKIDPVTGELHAFAYWFAEPYLIVPRDRRERDAWCGASRSRCRGSVMMHDFAIARAAHRVLRSPGRVRPRGRSRSPSAGTTTTAHASA